MGEASSTILVLKLANKLDARNDLLNLTIGDLKLANKLVDLLNLTIVLAELRRLNLVTFKIVQLIVNGPNGIMVLVLKHVEVE